LGQLILYWHNIPPDETYYKIVGFEWQCLWRDHFTFKIYLWKLQGQIIYVFLYLSGLILFFLQNLGAQFFSPKKKKSFKLNGRSLKLTCKLRICVPWHPWY
jgi:hypothetical protein